MIIVIPEFTSFSYVVIVMLLRCNSYLPSMNSNKLYFLLFAELVELHSFHIAYINILYNHSHHVPCGRSAVCK